MDYHQAEVPVQGFIFLHVYMQDLYACTCLKIVENLAVDLSRGTSYIYRCICGIFAAQRKVVPMYFGAVAIFTLLPSDMLLLEQDVQDHETAYGSENVRYSPCPIACPITVQP